MIRLSLIAQDSEENVLKLEGEVVREDFTPVAKEIESRLLECRRLVLDLEGVTYIDQTGLGRLKSWVGRGLVLRGGSWFIRELLGSQGL